MLTMLAVITLPLLVPAPLDAERILDCIRAVENWDGRTAGRAGEWGHWQMRPKVWAHYSSVPQVRASPQEERRVAREHLAWIRKTLHGQAVKETPYAIALCWTAGTETVLRAAASPQKRDYATRARALYEDVEFR